VGVVHRVLGRAITIGRALDADVRLDHPTISRRHARLVVAGERAFVEDLGSVSGTLVGIHLARGPTLVLHGAVIALGTLTLLRLTYSPVTREEALSSAVSFTSSAVRMTGSRFLAEQLRDASARAARDPSPLTLIILRADDLDPTADDAGADAAMGDLAVAIHEETGDDEVLARSSRDQFAILLPTNTDQARVTAEAVRARIAAENGTIDTVTAAVLPVRTSREGSSEDFVDWVQTSVQRGIADVRNRVVMFDATGLPDRKRPSR
jgi:GGDEF domain-containing protein